MSKLKSMLKFGKNRVIKTYSLWFSILLRGCEEVTVATMPSLQDEAVRVSKKIRYWNVLSHANGIVKCMQHHEGDVDLRHKAIAVG